MDHVVYKRCTQMRWTALQGGCHEEVLLLMGIIFILSGRCFWIVTNLFVYSLWPWFLQDPFVYRSLLCAQLMLPLVKDMEAPPPKPQPVVDEEDMEENVSHMTWCFDVTWLDSLMSHNFQDALMSHGNYIWVFILTHLEEKWSVQACILCQASGSDRPYRTPWEFG